jgi:ABC-2 type transport system permease protein
VTLISYRWAVLRRAGRYGWAEYRNTFPSSVVIGLMLPRVAFQMAFLTFVGGLASPDGQRFAFVGAGVQALSLAAVVYAGIDVSRERYDGTAVQIRLSRTSMALVRLAHSLAYIAVGLVFSVVGTLVVGVALGYGELSLRLVALLPLYAIAAVSMLPFGLAVATLARTELVTVLVNLANAVLLVFGGIVVPLSHLGPLAAVSHLLPGVNVLLALRAAVDGVPFGGLVLAECGVAVLWTALLVVADLVVAARVRRGVGGRGDGG